MNEIPGHPKLQLPTVDVRDIAQAHLQAVLVKEAANKRFLMSARTIWLGEMGHALKEYYGDYYSPCQRELPWLVCWFAQWVIPDFKITMPLWGLDRTYDNSQAREVLGIEFIDPKQSICEMGDSMIDLGLIPDQRK
uniref:Uncharacterized protein n=1 Tax=Strombidium inclinatum TaxID=197538 RepID=A0A7S3ICJ8_9SPIT|mmetsp:Transcript_10801/g.16416  ORF Transcript_10801/g.16416 Transcript_10801/m.16416 type:complete len:136 (+) Transcript_10801:139-546(+)